MISYKLIKNIINKINTLEIYNLYNASTKFQLTVNVNENNLTHIYTRKT